MPQSSQSLTLTTSIFFCVALVDRLIANYILSHNLVIAKRLKSAFSLRCLVAFILFMTGPTVTAGGLFDAR